MQLRAVGIQSTTITSCNPSCIWEYVFLKQLSQICAVPQGLCFLQQIETQWPPFWEEKEVTMGQRVFRSNINRLSVSSRDTDNNFPPVMRVTYGAVWGFWGVCFAKFQTFIKKDTRTYNHIHDKIKMCKIVDMISEKMSVRRHFFSIYGRSL